MVIREGETHYSPISWADAFELIGEHIRATTPDRCVFYTSGRTANETAFMYQLFARALGTNNLPDCSNMCHESSGSALNPTIGIGKGTVSLDDIHDSELIFVVGQNPGTNHPRMLSALKECKDKGGKVVAVNPLPEAGLFNFKDPQTVSGVVGGGTPLADEYLQIKVGGDLALFQALGHLLLAEEERNPGTVVDRSFIDAQTDGFDAYRDARRELDWAETEKATGLDRAQIETVAGMLIRSKATIFCWALGVTQQPHSVDTIKEMVNVLLLQGNFGKPGAGACPVRGHSNVQGDRTMGIWEKAQGMAARRPGHGIRDPVPAASRLRRRGVHGGLRTRRRGRLCVHGRQLLARLLGHRDPGSGHAADRPDRPHLHQAQPVPRGARPHLPDPAHAGPDGQGRQAPQGRAVPVRGGLHVRGPLHPGQAGAGVRAPARRTGDRGTDGRGHLRRRTTPWTGRPWPRTTTWSATTSPASCPASRTSTPGSGPRTVLCCPTRRATPGPSRRTSAAAASRSARWNT